MSKKIPDLRDYISAGLAAQILSNKLGRPINPDYIHRMKNVRSFQVNSVMKLYHRADIEAATIRQKAHQAH